MDRITLNGFSLAYNRRGKGAQHLLLHGYPLDHSIWDKTAGLLEKNFDLILPDLRGFGGSGTVNVQYGLEDMAGDLLSLMDKLGVSKAYVSGHSMGGYLALAFARLHPDRVLGLGLVSTQLMADPQERKEGRYRTASDVVEKGVAIVADAMSPKLTPDPALQRRMHSLITAQSKAGVVGALKAMAERTDSTSFISSSKLPIVIVHGDKDDLIPLERARETRQALPAARLLELAGVGHLPMIEAAFETAWALRQLQ